MNDRGFTLVEVLVALIAGGLLLGSISWMISGLSDDLKATERLDRELQISNAANLLDEILIDGRFFNGSSQALPRSPELLEFQMHAPLSLSKKGYILSQLFVDRTANGARLKLGFPGQGLPETILLSNVEDIELRYETSVAVDGDPAFLKKIEIAIINREGSEPQTLSIRPRINAVGACIFDLISQRCRT